MTSIVNLRKAKYDVYIGRAGRGEDGYFGNPIVRGRRCPVCNSLHLASGETLPCYKRYFEQRLEQDPEFRQHVLALRGQTLGCFCKPAPCHGDIIIAWLNSQEKEA